MGVPYMVVGWLAMMKVLQFFEGSLVEEIFKTNSLHVHTIWAVIKNPVGCLGAEILPSYMRTTYFKSHWKAGSRH